jgi:hypothetical protein
VLTLLRLMKSFRTHNMPPIRMLSSALDQEKVAPRVLNLRVKKKL